MINLKSIFFLIFIIAVVPELTIGSANAATLDERFTENDDDFSITSEKLLGNSEQNITPEKVVKFIRLQVVELHDTNGLKYIGGKVNTADVLPYLDHMKSLLGEDFARYRQNQIARDRNGFHITLINPVEYQHLSTSVDLGKFLSFSLIGLGKATTEQKATYYVVAQSSEAQFYRQRITLPRKDFHITLGFNPTDIYDVSKGLDTVIQ